MSVDALAEVWLVDIARCSPALDAIEATERILTQSDHQHLEHLADPVRRAERRSAAVAMRMLAVRVLGPAALGAPWRAAPTGKPGYEGAGGDVSLAHVDGAALIAACRSGSLGVDLERMREVKIADGRRLQIEAAAGRLAPGHPLPSPVEARQRFLQAWVRLEAAAKTDGRGIGRWLADLGVLRGAAGADHDGLAQRRTQAACPDPRLPAGLSVYDLQPGPGLVAALAWAGEAGAALPAPVLHHWPHDAAALGRLFEAAIKGRRGI